MIFKESDMVEGNGEPLNDCLIGLSNETWRCRVSRKKESRNRWITQPEPQPSSTWTIHYKPILNRLGLY